MENRNLNLVDENINIRNLALMLTHQCQMACHYCFLNRSYPDMSEEILYKSIDLLLTSSEPEVELQFFGGEPLLRFDLIKKAIDYAEEKSREKKKSVRYLLTTNGLLLDESKIDYFINYDANILFSIDGAENTQYKNRPCAGKNNNEVFLLIEKNLKMLTGKKVDYFVNMVFLPEDLDSLKRNIEYLISLGVKDIQLSYAIGVEFTKEDIQRFLAVFKEISSAGGVKLRNFCADNEPILSSPQITVDSEGKIYIGCALVLEKSFPEFNKLFYAGRIENFREISALRQSRAQQIRLLAANIEKLPPRVLTNLYFGLVLDVFLKYHNFLGSRNLLLSELPQSPADNAHADTSSAEVRTTESQIIRSMLDSYCKNQGIKKIIANNLILAGIPRSFFTGLLVEEKEKVLFERDSRFVNSLMVMCTYRCQFECGYCEVEQKNSSMPMAILSKTVDCLLTTHAQECQLRFWGGEPLLRWSFIKEGIFYGLKQAASKGKKIRFMITTNGLLLDQRKLNFLKNYPVEIMFSLDGDAKTNNLHRFLHAGKTISKVLLTNLKELIKSDLPYFVNMAVTLHTVNNLCDNLDFLKSIKVKKVQLCYQCGIIWPEEKTQVLIEELKKFSNKYSGSDFLMNFTNNCEPTMLSQEVLVDTDGKVYFDAAIFMEKVFPRLKNSYFVNEIDKIECIDYFYRTKKELYQKFENACVGHQKDILSNNINLGLKLDSFFNSFSYESLKSNEHPLFIPVVKGDFFLQKKLLDKVNIGCLFLYLDGPCLNNCLFCKHKNQNDYSDIFKIEAKLNDNRQVKSGKLSIIGNDPLLHPEIADIVKASAEQGFKTIEIMTSGERLADKKFCRRLIENGVSAFSLPLFASRPDLHDYIVGREGSFSQVLKGIDNAIIGKAKVFVHTNLIKQNIDCLKELEMFVKEKLGLPFIIFPIRPKSAGLPFSELMPSYAEVIEKLKGIDSLMGFPLCVVGKVQKNLVKSGDELSDSMKIYLLDQKFWKSEVCKQCKYYNRCLGLFKEYAAIYSIDNINPL